MAGECCLHTPLGGITPILLRSRKPTKSQQKHITVLLMPLVRRVRTTEYMVVFFLGGFKTQNTGGSRNFLQLLRNNFVSVKNRGGGGMYGIFGKPLKRGFQTCVDNGGVGPLKKKFFKAEHGRVRDFWPFPSNFHQFWGVQMGLCHAHTPSSPRTFTHEGFGVSWVSVGVNWASVGVRQALVGLSWVWLGARFDPIWGS